MSNELSHQVLHKLYIEKKYSVPSIAFQFKCSENKVNYWLSRYKIPKRTISEAIYLKHNPHGDPFIFRLPQTAKEERLYGLGIGLFWGEGNKVNKSGIRIGNTDPGVIKSFMLFLKTFFSIPSNDLKFHLQIFSDVEEEKAVSYWVRQLKVNRSQFTKTTVTLSGSIGTYRKKNINGVLTLYYHNTKSKKLLDTILADIAQG